MSPYLTALFAILARFILTVKRATTKKGSQFFCIGWPGLGIFWPGCLDVLAPPLCRLDRKGNRWPYVTMYSGLMTNVTCRLYVYAGLAGAFLCVQIDTALPVS